MGTDPVNTFEIISNLTAEAITTGLFVWLLDRMNKRFCCVILQQEIDKNGK